MRGLGHGPRFPPSPSTQLELAPAFLLMAEVHSSCFFQEDFLNPCSPALLLKHTNLSHLGNCKLQSHLFTGSFHQVHSSPNLEHPALTFLKLTTSASFPLFQNL